jgi:hypothetical protein
MDLGGALHLETTPLTEYQNTPFPLVGVRKRWTTGTAHSPSESVPKFPHDGLYPAPVGPSFTPLGSFPWSSEVWSYSWLPTLTM